MTDPARWGVLTGYRDGSGRWVRADPGVVSSVLSALSEGEDEPSASPLLTVCPGDRTPIAGVGEVLTDQGSVISCNGFLPDGLPLGYHRLVDRSGERELAVTPPRCPLPADLFGWGWSCQLYAARSESSWGLGDLADLRELGRWSTRALGARVLMINPLHADSPTIPQQDSPYYPASRCWQNALYLSIEEVPGAAQLGSELAPLRRAGRMLNQNPLIDRNAVYGVKMAALEAIWKQPRDGAPIARWARQKGQSLLDWAHFCVISEAHPGSWRNWPEALRRPRSAAVVALARERAERVNFHIWLQWLLDIQLRSAGQSAALIKDLALGSGPDGADAWIWGECLQSEFSLGAPPDSFNAGGQDWQLPPFNPWRLRRAGYGPFKEVLRAAFRHAAGIRIDHVLGLFRQYWIPAEGESRGGLYVRFPADDLLRILALEAHRADAFVVGEDLGTIAAGVRQRLAKERILSCRLLYFEQRPPATWPVNAMASVSTHDLPTVAGLWSRHDSEPVTRERLRERAELDPAMGLAEVVERTHQALARAPCRLVMGQLDDALLVLDRPNRPGTGAESKNWRRALPRPLEEVFADPGPGRLAAILAR
ncbi:MAG: 4-alpha-glucanotransferase [Candidatus Dormibacteraceae bacterium]